MISELLEQLRPILGEFLAILITALIAWIKKKNDINKMDSKITKYLENTGTPTDKIERVKEIVRSKFKHDDHASQA